MRAAIVIGAVLIGAGVPAMAADGTINAGSSNGTSVNNRMKTPLAGASVSGNALVNSGGSSGETGSSTATPPSQANDPINRPKEMDPGKQQ